MSIYSDALKKYNDIMYPEEQNTLDTKDSFVPISRREYTALREFRNTIVHNMRDNEIGSKLCNDK